MENLTKHIEKKRGPTQRGASSPRAVLCIEFHIPDEFKFTGKYESPVYFSKAVFYKNVISDDVVFEDQVHFDYTTLNGEVSF